MAPKSIKNRSKLSFRAFLFPHRFLHRFFIDFCSQLRPTGSPKSKFFLRKNKVFSKNRFSKLASIFDRFWCQHASILPPKIHQNPSKNRFQDASFFRSIFASIFLRFCFDLGGQLGAMLATFSLKIRRPNLTPGSFMLGLSFFSSNRSEEISALRVKVNSTYRLTYSPQAGRPGPLLAPSGLDLGGFELHFGRFLVSIFFTISRFFATIFLATLALC